MKYLTTVIKMDRLGADLPQRVRAKEEGLFKDTLIRDGEHVYGYDRDGKGYGIDVDDLPDVARFLWHHDEKGHLVTINVSDRKGRLMRMEELIMGAWGI